MNQDPFRFLKKKKRSQSQLINNGTLNTKYNELKSQNSKNEIENFSSTISKFKIQQYNPKKYSNSKCQAYLKSIKFVQQQSISRLTEVESQNLQSQQFIQYQQPKELFRHFDQKNQFPINNGQELKQCLICYRSFNPTSYIKHIKVCQRIFFNKRKPFSSQKQRSKSKSLKK